MTIKALLLAAGFGTRLRPLTNTTPKCLVPFGTKPILQLWLEKLEQINCRSALINTHYLSEKVHSFVDSYCSNSQMNINISYEPTLLGTAGTLLSNLDFFDGSLSLLIHADNFMYESLSPAIAQHKQSSSLLTMVTFTTNSPQSCGIVKIDSGGVVQSFHEKVSNPPGNIANGAIYIFDKRFVDFLRTNFSGFPSIVDFSAEIIPLIVGQIRVWHTKKMFADIGTLESYKLAQDFYTSNGIE